MKLHIKPCNCKTCLEAREQAIKEERKKLREEVFVIINDYLPNEFLTGVEGEWWQKVLDIRKRISDLLKNNQI